jgi:mono/diheme cytochrome c family protein
MLEFGASIFVVGKNGFVLKSYRWKSIRMKRTSASLMSVALAAATATAAVDYVKDVKPIFAENCYRCHGASQQKSGLRLDTAALALKGGEKGSALKPGHALESLMIQAIKGTHPDIARMPYKKSPLSDAQIALIEQWIEQGAKAPADEAPESNKHWAFVAPVRVPPPAVKQSDWPRNAIDYFVLARLEKERIKPAVEADRVTLIRRLSLDLIGLPPSISEVDEFVKDPRPDAYDRWVERLLGSPHYGERWGRHWLDVARYADSNGYSIDAPRSIWKYRDWVVNALNKDLPFDQFVIEQLAGDLLPNATLEQKIATGFHRNTQINQEGGIDPEQFRVESVMDRVNTTATAFLGLTIGCAQCHDHKFDPILQREYYQIYAFFNSTVEDGHGKGAPGGMLEIPGEVEGNENIEKELEEAEADLDRYLDTKGSEVLKWEQALTEEETAKLKPEVRKALKIPFPERTKKQKRIVYASFRADDAEFKSRNSKLAQLEKKEARPVTTLVMSELKEPRETFVFIKGDFTRPGAPVTPAVPAILNPLHISNHKSENTNSTATRLDLARWIVDPANPLTARVTVNRIWQQYFGRGLVETENDFGTQGSLPTHPELLDWLATELIRQNWSLKAVHRLIVTSATYRQNSRIRPELDLVDPNNKLLARQPRLRLDAEVVRDAALGASGLLSTKIGGPPVFPPQPGGVMTLGQLKRDWKPSAGADRYRRGLYTYFWRATPHPALTVFDAADGFSACTRRLRSNTPLQALTLLNDQAFYEFAEAFARRILFEAPRNDAERIDYAFHAALSRQPSNGERERLHDLFAQQFAQAEGDPKARERQAWTTLARVMLNLDEAITRE